MFGTLLCGKRTTTWLHFLLLGVGLVGLNTDTIDFGDEMGINTFSRKICRIVVFDIRSRQNKSFSISRESGIVKVSHISIRLVYVEYVLGF